MAATFNENYLFSGTFWRFTAQGAEGTRALAPLGSGGVLSYSLINQVPAYWSATPGDWYIPASASDQLTPAQRDAVVLGLTRFQDVTGLTFTNTGLLNGQPTGQLAFGNLSNESTDYRGNFPSTPLGLTSIQPSPQFAGDVWFPTGASNAATTVKNPLVGAEDFETILHETGHALGLSHDGRSSPLNGMAVPRSLERSNSNPLFTMMSYRRNPDTGLPYSFIPTYLQTLYAVTPMLFDIAQLQRMYGANFSHKNEEGTLWNFGDNSHPFMEGMAANSVYRDPGKILATIWDGDGNNDWIDAAGITNRRVYIDLRPGEFSAIGTLSAGGQTSSVDKLLANIGIAYGTMIENAAGGGGSDTLIGNHVINRLDGGARTIGDRTRLFLKPSPRAILQALPAEEPLRTKAFSPRCEEPRPVSIFRHQASGISPRPCVRNRLAHLANASTAPLRDSRPFARCMALWA